MAWLWEKKQEEADKAAEQAARERVRRNGNSKHESVATDANGRYLGTWNANGFTDAQGVYHDMNN